MAVVKIYNIWTNMGDVQILRGWVCKGGGSDSRCPELTLKLVLACNAIGPVASIIDPVTTLRLVLDLCLGTHTHTLTPPPYTRNTHTTSRNPPCPAGLSGPDWLREWHTNTHTHTLLQRRKTHKCIYKHA